MDVDAMTTEKQNALMKRGACFICEETGHLAQERKDYMEKKKRKTRGNNPPSSQKKMIKEIHALLQVVL